ncbi:PREDICTED: LOW QUALITY PROTEIN: uncharacterized protein LOC107188592 [Dufourea novaeangliae]|uniref:LOW QUALITY PROTEIN: uncharacterized protein LOC107188592 n=1 Tax=Dufourea novaeangliae TaxID=178035 RepID=UPI000766F8CF|nr:PREDICTED: LOW QUALITY PROTEIN: uncharacterized protein LOC107188592 [Dufourea novaeangliae]
MMKHVVFLFAVFCLVHSQRPPYAGSPERTRYPQVLPQYLEERATAMSVSNRLNGDASVVPTTTVSTTTINPLDALGDIDLINRIKTWPKEKQPFWYLNWVQIQENRGDTRHRTQPTPLSADSRFMGY